MKKEEKTALTKRKIYAAAMQEFGTKGYLAGSINHICKSGINKGLIYHNFKDKDALYLACVQKSCVDFIRYVTEHMAQTGFVAYMEARMQFFAACEMEAYIFLEARSNPPMHLKEQISAICADIDALNTNVLEQDLRQLELRENVSREDAMDYFMEIQKIFQLGFIKKRNEKIPVQEQLLLHEGAVRKLYDLFLYGIAKGGKQE
ncbi:MAG: TetR/AcrR family transcriptional regulator [Roseburia sp.]